MLPAFDIAAASVMGREHARAGRNNQDALCVRSRGDVLAAVVTDGCGSAAHSEVGAQLGARCVADVALAVLERGISLEAPEFLETVRAEVLGFLSSLTSQLGSSLVGEHLLFTVVGAVVTPSRTLVFSAGDGLWALNGEVHALGPFPHNAPPYLAYGLLSEGAVPLERQALVPTEEVVALMLGTDGAVDLGKLTEARVAETEEPVGPLSQYWSNERYFQNPDALRRRLTLLGRESVRADFTARRLVRTPGLLADDTTLIVLRRRMERV
ncbi:protein phosphatase 2C domain-containing protein [Hyalangium rubrum]|uniref:Protein phosphatase 2C domain-containing protein n=1 Tax=Hyalangium rubrum TaxID=3103134 RepID=A0ABU5HAW1_9BACT|nr:protein phosphatase 2C domain-containing protein [Hyalangium sp. s54d21]MDY7230229.1 protein phosphatase 2C domain-containing protein [Hyalangium sp. s54d21]